MKNGLVDIEKRKNFLRLQLKKLESRDLELRAERELLTQKLNTLELEREVSRLEMTWLQEEYQSLM